MGWTRNSTTMPAVAHFYKRGEIMIDFRYFSQNKVTTYWILRIYTRVSLKVIYPRLMKGWKHDIDDRELWEARSFARNSILVIMNVATICVASLDVESEMTPVVVIILTLPALYAATIYMRPNSKEFVFSLYISLVSVLGMLQFTLVALTGQDESKFRNGADRVTAVQMHRRGEIPSAIILFFIVPAVATPAGMNVEMAKKVSLMNCCLFTVIAMAIRMNINSELCLHANEIDETYEDIRLLNFSSDLIMTVTAFAYAFFACVPGAEVTEAYARRLKAGRQADSVLNHVLKNKVAGAAAAVEIFIQDNPSTKPKLQAACEMMYLSMSWCAIRQTMIDLAAGAYKSALVAVYMHGFLQEVVPPSVAFECIDETRTKSDHSNPALFHFDRKMANLALENVISNAVAHGDNIDTAIQLGVSFVRGDGADCQQEEESFGEGSLVFTVENQLPAGVRLTNDILQKLTVDSIMNGTLKRMVEATYEDAPRPVLSKKKSNSTNSGLKHATLACKGAGGSFSICMGSGGKSVVARIFLPAKKVKVVKADPGELIEFEALHSSPKDRCLGLRVCCLDDSKMICKGYERLLLPSMQANIESSLVTCPKSPGDVQAFVDDVLGSDWPTDGDESIPFRKAADIVILDQNIDLKGPDKQIMYGTDVAITLKARGFIGLTLLRTGNSSLDENENYIAWSKGAVDAILGKDGNYCILANQIYEAYARKKMEKREGPNKMFRSKTV